jgi:hypothetical protein
MRPLLNEQTLLGGLILALAGVSPNIFPLAQAGYAKMSFLGAAVLLPAIALLAVVLAVTIARGHRELVRIALIGAAAGALATLGLELVRTVSFRLGGMPGDLPRLMGVLLTDRFMLGPSALSDVLGYAYHFWNGAVFGLIFAILAGRRPLGWALIYGELVGLGFLASPAVKALGVGFMGLDKLTMPLTVLIAHAAFGLLLGVLTRRWIGSSGLAFGLGLRKPAKSSSGAAHTR